MTPTNRTVKHLEEHGIRCGNVERYVHQVRKRYDLFGFIDAIAIYPDTIAGLQITSGSNVSSRITKIMDERREQCEDFMRVAIVEVWGWRKLSPRGTKAVRWKPRVMRASLSRGQIVWHEIDADCV
jgi:hypothetical protein